LADNFPYSLIPLPLYIIAITVALFVPEIRSVKSVPSTPQPIPASATESSLLERTRTRLASLPGFVRKNIAVITLLLVFPIVLFPNHGFALLYISKKFDTSLANVRLSFLPLPSPPSSSRATKPPPHPPRHKNELSS